MKLIEMPHKVCGVTCMVNGLEDLYEAETGVRLPDWLFLHLSDLLGFVYIKNKNAPTPRMVFWGANVAKYQYEALADIVGFQWQMVSDRSFPFTLQKVKTSLDQGIPAILGVLDMYHLPYYEKFYHKIHVPIHYVMMVGYDDDQQVALVQDCDRPEVLHLPYTDLEAAWNVNIPGLGKKNTFYTFEFHDRVADVESIARNGLQKRGWEMLNAPVSMLGLKGMRKLASELTAWPAELNSKQLQVCLRHLAEFTGFPPVLPHRLTGYNDAPDNHAAGRDIFAGLLENLSDQYTEPNWADASRLFVQSGHKLEELTDEIVDVILGEGGTLKQASTILSEIADIEERAFGLLLD